MRSLSGPQVAVATQQPIDPLATCRLDPVAAAVLEGVLQYRKAGFPLLCGGWVVLRVWTKAFSMQGKHCAIDCISSSLKYVGFFNFFFNNSWLPFHPRQQCILFALLRKHSCSLSLSQVHSSSLPSFSSVLRALCSGLLAADTSFQLS